MKTFKNYKLVVCYASTYNSGTLETRWADLSDIAQNASLYSEFQASHRFMVRLFFKTKGNNRNTKE